MFRVSLGCLLLALSPVSAAVLTIGNMTSQTVQFRLGHPGETAETIAKLEPGEHRLFQVGRTPIIAYEAQGKPVRFQLDPYTPYVFAPQGKSYGLQGIELAAAMPRLDAIPLKPPSNELHTIKLRVFVDDADPRARMAWEKQLRDRMGIVSDVLQRQCQLKLEITEFGEWASDGTATTATELLQDFQQKTATKADLLTVGFASRTLANQPRDLLKSPEYLILPGCLRGPGGKHLLIREALIRSESARIEMLIHELGHYLGAVHSPDLNTSLRVNVLDGRNDLKEVRVGFDPINLLVVGIWLEEMRAGPVNGPADLREDSRARLKVLYRTLQSVQPEDTLASAYLGELEKNDKAVAGEAFNLKSPLVASMPGAGGSGQNLKIPAEKGPERVTVPVAPAPAEARPYVAPVVPANPTDPREQAIRQVVRAITARAKELREVPQSQRPRGDALTSEYIVAAAIAAGQQSEPHRSAALLVGLGIGLDDSKVLRSNPLATISAVCRSVESDSEFQERVAYLGQPTMRYRRDLCQHFAVSAALTELVGAKEAEMIGLTKELLDSQRASGFSFPDLCADYAGVAWASRIKSDPGLITKLKKEASTSKLLPSVADLPEGLTTKRFLAEYGSPQDPRFEKLLTDIRQRIAQLADDAK